VVQSDADDDGDRRLDPAKAATCVPQSSPPGHGRPATKSSCPVWPKTTSWFLDMWMRCTNCTSMQNRVGKAKYIYSLGKNRVIAIPLHVILAELFQDWKRLFPNSLPGSSQMGKLRLGHTALQPSMDGSNHEPPASHTLSKPANHISCLWSAHPTFPLRSSIQCPFRSASPPCPPVRPSLPEPNNLPRPKIHQCTLHPTRLEKDGGNKKTLWHRMGPPCPDRRLANSPTNP